MSGRFSKKEILATLENHFCVDLYVPNFLSMPSELIALSMPMGFIVVLEHREETVLGYLQLRLNSRFFIVKRHTCQRFDTSIYLYGMSFKWAHFHPMDVLRETAQRRNIICFLLMSLFLHSSFACLLYNPSYPNNCITSMYKNVSNVGPPLEAH